MVRITTTHYHNYVQEIRMRKKYGVMSFVGDVLLTLITGGLWLIWIFVREMRGR